MQHDDDDDDAITLPLRLAAEPHAKKIFPSSVALSVHPELAILVDDRGIVGLASERAIAQRESLLEMMPTDVRPSFRSVSVLLLVRGAESSFQWHVFPESKDQSQTLPFVSSDHALLQPVHDQASAKWITTAIRKYYAQQILEPSVRGFLSVLEKQFSQSNLYVFELLQNAVDDGATSVRFSTAGACLEMVHNGRRFTPLDVLGLSSVGLSTKSRQGKRTVGFMGVGFKAVYKRYAKVTIRDGRYAFCYQEPPKNNNNYGWVMLPLWQHSDSSSSSDPDGSPQVRFELQQPRGGVDAILRDLSILPRTAPPLLGRAALVKQEREQSSDNNEWVLDWNGKVHTVKRTQLTKYNDHDSSEIVNVDTTNTKDGTTRTTQWLFLTHKYTPSRQAMESYQKHTKRSHSGVEEVCGFLPLSGDKTIASKFTSGVVHSVLPTKIRLPIPLHLQGSFLLSVDRQQVQDLSDNAWNLNILLKLPSVIAIAFRWAARHQVTDYTGISKLLPIPMASTTSQLSCQLLNQTVSLQGLQSVLYKESTLPVAMAAKATENQNVKKEDAMEIDGPHESKQQLVQPPMTTAYYEGCRSVWVPPCFLQFLRPDFLRGWLGKRPIRTDAFGKEGAYHPLWKNICDQLEPIVPNRIRQLEQELELDHKRVVKPHTIEQLVRIMAAIGTVLPSEDADGAKKTKKDDNNSNEAIPPPPPPPKLPPKTNIWPLFLTETGELATIEKVVLPSEDMASVPSDLLPLLRPFFLQYTTTTANNLKAAGKGGGKWLSKKRKLNKQQPNLNGVQQQRLHPLLESAICALESGGTMDTVRASVPELKEGVCSFLQRVRQDHPKQLVDVATAVSRLLESLANTTSKRTLTDDEVARVVQLSQFALDSNNHRMFSFVLVDDSSGGGVRLVTASKAYIGKLYDENGPGADLESFAGNKLAFVSAAYNAMLPTKVYHRRFVSLMTQAGVQTGLAFTVSAIRDVERDRKLLAEEILPKLPSKKLPSLRNKNTKCELQLPYGLGATMNRKKYSLLDSELALEWENLVQNMTADCAKGFISLLLTINIDDAAEVTPKSVPAAASCLQGQGEASNGDTGTSKIAQQKQQSNNLSARVPNEVSVPIRRRLYFLPPGIPGCKALDMGESRIIKQLRSLKWLPCKLSSDSEGSLELRRPEEALLHADKGRPEMPVVCLPPVLKRRLEVSPLVKGLTFGTKAPPPPISELSGLAKEAKAVLASHLLDTARIQSLSTQMVLLWCSIARVHLRDGLSSADMSNLRTLLQGDYCFPVQNVIDAPAGGSNWIVEKDRCIRMMDTVDDKKKEIKYRTLSSLVASDFMCDFYHSRHNPFFHQPEVSTAVQKLWRIADPASVSTQQLIRVSGSFIRFCWKKEPVIANRLSPLRPAFSYGMKWCLKAPTELPPKEKMKVWVRSGPGVGSKALRRRWISVCDDEIQPVLDDNRARSSLLTHEMGIQLLGVLNHTENERDCPNAKLLASIDREALQHLGIWRLSDTRFTVKTKAEGPGKPMQDASSRLQLVLALMKSLVRLEYNDSTYDPTGEQSGNSFLDVAYQPPLLVRHKSLTRAFKGPRMDSPSMTPMYAVFGRAPKLTEGRCILVSGDPDDYAMELEELVAQHVGARFSVGNNQPKPWRAAIRLLSHMENESSFIKFVKRDFDDDEVTKIWRRLQKRKSVLSKLREVEKEGDLSQLKEILIQAEEACEDDPDGGDSVLKSARDAYERLLEEEEKKRVQALEELKEATTQDDTNKLRLSILLAQKLFKDDSGEATNLIKAARDRFEVLKLEAKSSELPNDDIKESHQPVSVDTANQEMQLGMGRGRGRTLPAWMTSSEGPVPMSAEALTSNAGANQHNDGETDDASQKDVEAVDSVLAGRSRLDDSQLVEGRGRGRGRTLPAWMTSNDGPSGESNIKVEETQVDGQMDDAPQEESGGVNSLAAGLKLDDSQLAGEGQGRGLGRTLPAWITSNDGPSKLENAKSEEAKDGESQPQPASIDSATRTVATGMGRGQGRTLPAWMTSRDGPQHESPRTDGDAAQDVAEESKKTLARILNNGPDAMDTNPLPPPPQGVLPPPAETHAAAAAGRGRGVSRTLPAWMTNEGPKRPREDGDSDDNDGRSKRARTLESYEYSLKLNMDPKEEAGFRKWLETTIKSKAETQGGRVTLDALGKHND